MSKKILALALVFAFAFSFTTKAVTIEELQNQIQQLQLMLAQLQGTQAPSSQMYCFNSDLEYKMTSPDVKNLQIVLNKDPNTRVAVSGAGSPGQETNYFGSLTLAAVKKFQAANAIPTTGYVGPLTRAALNAKYCVPPTTTTTVPTESTTTTTTVAPSYGTLSVTTYPVSNPQSTWYGNSTYEAMAGQYKATGSDITIKKVAVKITSSAASAFPWQAFTAISVWDGSTKLAELPVTQANAIENTFAKDYTFNISGLNWVIPNGQQKVLTVKVTTTTNPPAAATALTWVFTLMPDVVHTDTAGVTYSSLGTTTVTSSTISLSSSQTSTITISYADGNPKEGNVVASKTASTKVDVLKFNVKVENINATLNSGSLNVQVDGANKVKTTYITALELWDGSTLVTSAAPGTWVNSSSTVSWTNFSLPIAAGTTKTLTVKAVIAVLPPDFTEGGWLKIQTGPSFDGIDANSNALAASGAAIVGYKQYVYITAPTLALVSVSGQKTNPDSGPSTYDAVIKFSVTANNGDIYIHDETENLGDASTFGITATLTGASNTSSFSYSSDAEHDTDNDYYKVFSGTTKTFTVSAHLVGSSTYASAAISKIYWTSSSTIAVASGTTNGYELINYGLENYKTDSIYLEAS